MAEKKNLYAVIMAGGRGERFWPVSRSAHPKQFVSLFGGKPLITLAVERLQGLVSPEHILVVTSADLVDLSRASLPMLPAGNILGEPFGRDTAAACAIGTAWVARQGGDAATVVVLTADHLIEDTVAFRQTLADTAACVSREPLIGVIGIVPEFAATGYGYVESESVLDAGTKTEFMKVRRFVEKPDEATAQKYVASGKHFWNSGMFVWSVSTFKAALKAFRPQLLEMGERMELKFGTVDFEQAFLAEYNLLDKISVDYAIMEKSTNIIAARGDFGWDDVGTWVSAAEHFAKDESGNAVHGRCELLRASGNTVVNTVENHLLAVMGLDDIVVVHTDDATLVCGIDSAQALKEMVKQVAEHGGKRYT